MSRTQGRVRDAYIWKRQTLAQIAEREKRSTQWVRGVIDASTLVTQTVLPRSTPLAADMTFLGRSYGVLVFRSPLLKRNLWWKEAGTESLFLYREGLCHLLAEGWTFTGVVIDGKRGVAQVFEDFGLPVQYCQFHQVKTVTKYLTRRPKSAAAKELRALALTLAETSEEAFKTQLAAWYTRWQTFLDETSPAPMKKRGWEYTHRRTRAAYRSLLTNLSRLFTYQKYPDALLPNTTNTLDGMFSQIKNRLAVHRGLRRDRRFNVISEILAGKRK